MNLKWLMRIMKYILSLMHFFLRWNYSNNIAGYRNIQSVYSDGGRSGVGIMAAIGGN